jgi:hypothetical protein
MGNVGIDGQRKGEEMAVLLARELRRGCRYEWAQGAIERMKESKYVHLQAINLLALARRRCLLGKMVREETGLAVR